MPPASHPDEPARPFSRPEIWLLIGVLLYGAWHLLWYWQTPLGRWPVLDEQENLQLARQIAGGTLAAEPFYRGMIYPWLLSRLFVLGVPELWVPQAATGFGLLLHAIGTLAAGAVARRWFRSRGAWVVAVVLHGLNPVLIHYATQVLDGVLANTLLLIGLWALVRAADARGCPGRWWIAASLAWSVAGLARPQLMILWVAFVPVAALLHPPPLRRRHWVLLGGAALVGASVFAAQGWVQHRRSGQFRILPAQGPYNLWAANKPGANGRYFAQSIYLPAARAQENPARVESLVLYRRETGDITGGLEAANRYWTSRFKSTLREEPAAVLKVQLRKLYYLLNHQEQYNNKTYAFHRARSPALRWNVIGWGLLWSAGLLGSAALALHLPRWRLPLGVGLLGLILAAGIMTGYVSGRFRLPLVAVLACLSGGVMRLPEVVQLGTPRTRAMLAAAWLVVSVAAFTRFGDIGDRSTFLQDHLLVAAAAERIGEDAECWVASGEALQLAPGRPDALALRLTSYFNGLLQGSPPSKVESPWWEAASQYLAAPPSSRVPAVEAIAAIARWRAGDEPTARQHLRRLARQDEPARREGLAGLIVANLADATDRRAFAEAPPAGPIGILVGLATVADGPASAPGTSDLQSALAGALQRLRDRPAPGNASP